MKSKARPSMHHSEQALAIADRAVQEEPRTTLVRAVVALLLLHNGQVEKAQDVVERLQQDPNAVTTDDGINAVVALAQAEMWLDQGQAERTLAFLEPLQTLEDWPYEYFELTYLVALAEASKSSSENVTPELIPTLQTRQLSEKTRLAKRIAALNPN